MKMTRRILSWVLAIALVVTCGITGLVLPVAAEDATNLFVNGDFEEGVTSAWENKPTLILEGVGKDGGWGYYHNRTETGAWTATGQVRYKASLNSLLERGATYILSFDYKTSGDAFPQLYFDIAIAEGFSGGVDVEKSVDTWTTKTYTFVTYDEFKNSQGYEFSIRTRGGAGEVWYDNLSLIKAPASIEFASETQKAEVGETVALDATFVNSAAADYTWASTKEDVATVENGVVTVKAMGETTISATLGDVTKSVVLSVVKDKTRVDMPADDFIYTSTNGEEWTKGDAVPVQNDATASVDYVTVTDAVASSTGSTKYAVTVPFNRTIEKDEWVGITFLARVNIDDPANSGKVRFCMRIDGGIANGYHQPEFYANSSKGWVRHTVYAKSKTTTSVANLVFYTYGSGVGGVTYPGKQAIDIASVYTFKPDEDEMNLAGVADFEDGEGPAVLGSYNAAGILHNAATTIATDPVDSTNKVLSIPATSNYVGVVNSHYYNAETGSNSSYSWSASSMYKITFRAYNCGTISVASWGNTKSTFPLKQGTSQVKDAWRTVTIYMKTAASGNNYASLHLTFGAAGYIDDFQIYKVPDATDFEIVANQNMPINSTQTVSYNTIPKHAYPGTVTLASSDSCITLSGTTLTATKTTGNVTGSTITATSDLLDEEGNPISGSLDITLVYPKEIFTGAIDGTMDSNEFTGFKWYDAAPLSVVQDPDDAENNVLKIDTTIPNNTGYTLYFQNVDLQSLKPNSLYRYSFMVKADEVIDMGASYDNRCTDISFLSSGSSSTKVLGEWVQVYAWVKTGDAPKFDSSSWNIRFAYSGSDKSTPIYLDNFSFALIDDYENRFDLNGGLEVLDKYLQSVPAANQAIVPDPEDASNSVLAYSGTFSSNDYMAQIPYLNPWSAYELTFDAKVDQTWIDSGSSIRLWWSGKNANIKGYYDSGFTGADAIANKTTWTKVKITIFTGPESSLPAESIYFTSSVKGGTMYIDNFSLKRVDNGHSLHGMISGGYDVRFNVNGTGYKNYVLDVPEGATVAVDVREHNTTYNKILKPLVLSTANGESFVLNKDITDGYTADNFGTGKGRTFEFIMGDSGTRVAATLTSASTTNYHMDTLGASLRYTDTEGVYDGIRFLTRVTMPDGVFLVDDLDNFSVVKDGVTYSVVEIGSYLKRYSETEGVEDKLTQEVIDAAEVRLWQSVAYKKGDAELGDMKLLDYTETYIDFTSVMLKGASVEQEAFNARKYTARGYMVLSDGENTITVLADGQVSASVNEIAPLVG